MEGFADKEALRRLCIEAGACAAGFARIRPVSDEAVAIYDGWIASGRHGTMAYMENYADVRRNPALLLDGGAQTLISCAFAYTSPELPRSPLFADYALGSDYHEVLRTALAPVAAYLEEITPGTRICVDTAPLRERYWAQQAGIGFVGLNNQLIVPGVGSCVFLAEILWKGMVEPDEPMRRHCDGCRACIEACPGHALDYDGGLDARRCLSYLTIEHRGDLPEGLSLPGRIYGCDICRDVCPYGHSDQPVNILPELRPRQTVLTLSLADIKALDQPSFSRIFSHSAVKRAKLAGLLRNASFKK